MSLALSLAEAAPIYNLGLVIVAVFLFIKLFTTPVRDKRVYLMPWKLLFFALLVFIVEEVITVLRQMEVINIPKHINGFFEIIIICTFIYTLILQQARTFSATNTDLQEQSLQNARQDREVLAEFFQESQLFPCQNERCQAVVQHLQTSYFVNNDYL